RAPCWWRPTGGPDHAVGAHATPRAAALRRVGDFLFARAPRRALARLACVHQAVSRLLRAPPGRAAPLGRPGVRAAPSRFVRRRPVQRPLDDLLRAESRATIAAMPHLVVVPHTHWDREWYRTHEQFRARLVALLDGLLPLLENDPEFRFFSLDGQTIV